MDEISIKTFFKFKKTELAEISQRTRLCIYCSLREQTYQLQLMDGGILATRNSANHLYCFLSNQKKVQILAFWHVICERIVSCPPPENRLQR